METLEEMKKGSLPDNTADYWEERKDIDKWIKIITEQISNLKDLEKIFKEKEKKFNDFSAQAKKPMDVPAMESLLHDINTES